MSTSEKDKILGILCRAFERNLSVDYTIGKSGRKARKLRRLIRYSLRVTEMRGKVLRKGNSAALITFGNKKAPFYKQLVADLGLVFSVIGIKRLKPVMARNNFIKSFHPQGPYLYLWLLGTDPQYAGQGEGSALLQEILALAAGLKMPLYLETSMPENIRFYEKNGFRTYHEQMIGDSDFLTYFMKSDIISKV